MVNCNLGGLDLVKMSELLFNALLQGAITAIALYVTFKIGQKIENLKWERNNSYVTTREQIDVLMNIVKLQSKIYIAAINPSTYDLVVFKREELEWEIKNYKNNFSKGSEITEQLEKLLPLINYIPQGPPPIPANERCQQSKVIIDDLIARIELLRSKIDNKSIFIRKM